MVLQNFQSPSLLKLKSKVADILCHPAIGQVIGKLFQNRIPYRRTRIEVPPEINHRTKAELFWGLYESAEARFISKYLDETSDVVELGASLGAISCQIAAKIKSGRRLIALEANPRLIPFLKKNLSHNAPYAQATIIHGAIHKPGDQYASFCRGSSSLTGSTVGLPGQNTEQVPAFSLSEILKHAQIQDCTLICDIEGAEHHLLRFDREALRLCKKVIIELHEVWNGEARITVPALVHEFVSNHNFELITSYGPVCVFRRCFP